MEQIKSSSENDKYEEANSADNFRTLLIQKSEDISSTSFGMKATAFLFTGQMVSPYRYSHSNSQTPRNVDFIHDYEEMGNAEIGLDNDEFEQAPYHYDEETETYHFQGKIFDNDCEILEILLEEKINHMQPQI